MAARAAEDAAGSWGEAAADHDVLRLEGVDGAGQAHAQVGAEPLEQLEGVLVLVVARRGDHVAAADLAAVAVLEQLAQPRVRVVLRELCGVALERQTAAERLEAAPVRARAGTVGAVPVDHLVAELGSEPRRAAKDLLVDDD